MPYGWGEALNVFIQRLSCIHGMATSAESPSPKVRWTGDSKKPGFDQCNLGAVLAQMLSAFLLRL